MMAIYKSFHHDTVTDTSIASIGGDHLQDFLCFYKPTIKYFMWHYKYKVKRLIKLMWTSYYTIFLTFWKGFCSLQMP